MAGATNRALKSAGLPKATIKTVRAESGGRLNLQSAIAVARAKGLDVGKAVAHLERRDAKAAVKAQPTATQPATQAVASRKGGAAPGRISDLRRVPILRNAALDVRATPTVLKEYFAPRLSTVPIGRRERLRDMEHAITMAVTNAPPGAKVVKFHVGALAEGGVRGTGEHRKFEFKARLLKGKGDGGKDMVALNMIGGAKTRQRNESRQKTIQNDAAIGNGLVRENGALRIKTRGDARTIPFKHSGETVYAVRDHGALSTVVRGDGSVVRNRNATKRAARVVSAAAARSKAGPSPAMKRGEANMAAMAQQATDARRAAAAATAASDRRAALIASGSRRGRTNPTAITNASGSLYGAEATFAHRGQEYRVRHTATLGTHISTSTGNYVSKPKKALKKRAERVIKAVAARVKSGGKGVKSRTRGEDEY